MICGKIHRKDTFKILFSVYSDISSLRRMIRFNLHSSTICYVPKDKVDMVDKNRDEPLIK